MPVQQLDVYRDWLGIKETARPLNHYQLLLLKVFEDDIPKVRSNYRKLNAHVRKYASGEYSEKSQELLNELAKAMLCLTDSKRKSEYDATLGRKDKGSDRRRSFEEILLATKEVDQAGIERARRFAKAVNVEMRDAVIQQKVVSSEKASQAYAESIGLPFVELADLILDEKLLRKMPVVMARQHSCAPILIDEGQLLVASPNPIAPDIEEQMRLRVGLPVRSVLCTVREINDVIAKWYTAEAAAAELAAASAKPAQSQPSKGKAAKAEAARSSEEGAEGAAPLSEEERSSQKKKYAIIGAAVACNAFILVATLLGWTKPNALGTTFSMLIGVGCGMIGGLVGYARGGK